MRLLILARNFNDFKRWCWDHHVPFLSATYVANPERLIGRRFNAQQIVRVPGHEENIHSEDIERAVLAGLVTS